MTKSIIKLLPASLALIALLSVPALPQQSTVYVAVVATKLFVVGANNAPTGLFYRNAANEDTAWNHTGPLYIRNFALAVYGPSKGKIMYIGAGNGVHATTDGGNSWKITTGWQITEVLWVATHPHRPEIVYCATPYGIFKTADGCKSWKEMNNGLNALFTQCVIVDQKNPDTLFCASEDGVYASYDGAATWRRLGLSIGGIRVIVQHPKDSGVLFAGSEEHGIYVTRNGGKWWDRSEAGIDHPTFYAITFDPVDPDVMYAGGYTTGVYKSVDGGKSWARKNEGLKNLNIHGIAVDPTRNDRVYVATIWGGVYRSDNGGELWRSAGLGGSEVWNISIQPN
jgi:photosystem II stability/assembly factor-like uncharacterized protein